MNLVLWIVQVLLAAAFGMAGFVKLSQSLDSLSGMMPWVTAVPALLVRFIGAAEVAGALGLILPRATKIQPQLTAYAGAALALVMLLAALFHASRGEFGNIVPTVVLFVLSIAVAYGRWPGRGK